MVQAYLAAETKAEREKAAKEFPALKGAFTAEAAARTAASEKIDSKSKEALVIGKIRNDIAIDIHKGRGFNVQVRAPTSKVDERGQQIERTR